MRRLTAALVALISLSSACYAAFAIFQAATSSRVQKNLVTDYGATCNGVANDTSAFLAFKAANQGTTPVQLNLPGNCTFETIFGNNNTWPFDGISDYIVQGTGPGSSSIKSFAGSQMLLGGKGQFQDNSHSVRTNDANAGDSCVILKTAPAVTISAIANNVTVPATFTGSIPISSTTLTTSSVTGTIVIGAYITNVDSSINPFTSIVSQSSGPAGGAGTYVLSNIITDGGGNPFAINPQTVTTVPVSATGSAAVTGIVTISAVANGTIVPGMYLYSADGNINKRVVQPYGTAGTTGVGGNGTYKLDAPPQTAVPGGTAFIGNGQPRVTLNSTTGLTTGDNLFLTGMTGRGLLPQRVNGLQWIKVINGTQIDIFQSDFNGSYTSGGTGGGDRTALFPIGAKALMTGWTNQAYWANPYGFPSNPNWFEYKTVISNNSTTHQVCFDTPLANTYKASWPQLNTGSQFEVDPGGPATLYVYQPTWEMTAVFKDLTIDNPVQTYIQGRNVTLNNVTMTGGSCVAPTQNETVNWTNVTGASCDIETDKIVKNWNVTNLSVFKVAIQSSSFTNINVNGVTTSSGWYGSGKNLVMQNANVVDLNFGIIAYGASEQSSCTSCAVSNVLSYAGSLMRVDLPNAPWSMSGGLITIPNAYSTGPSVNDTETQYRGMAPGTYMLWQGQGGGGTSAQTGRVFKVVSVTQDIDNTYIQTSEAGGFPTGAWTTNGLKVQPHPAPKLTTTSMSGANTALALNGCPAQTPMFSCQNFIYTGGASGTSSGYGATLWGVIDTFTFTNNVPYTNTGALGWTVTPSGLWQTLNSSNVTASWGNSNMINTKLPSGAGGGTRTLTSAGATGTQVGDTIPTPASDGWFGGGVNGPAFTANTPSDSPQVTITLRTNQQLPP